MTTSDERTIHWGEYLAQAAQGNQQAFAHFYDETAPLAYGLALKLLGNEADAQDTALDAYMQVWRSASRFDSSRGAPLTWLLMIVRTRALDRLRTRRPGGAGEEALALAPAAPDCIPSYVFEATQRQRLLRQAMGKLPDSIRRLVELAYFNGLSHAEIAEGTGQPLGTVKTRIRRGLKLMKEALEQTPIAIALL